MVTCDLEMAELRAKSLLHSLGILSPFDMPVDLDRVSRQLGLSVNRFDFTKLKDQGQGIENASGFLSRPKGVIVLNSNHSETRQRFTLAHEIGHYILHADMETEIVWRDHLSAAGTDPREMEANRFAGALLMPEDLFHSVLDAFTEDRAARFFNVSLEALRVRAKILARRRFVSGLSEVAF